jgi:hypothetical protein
MVWKFISNSIEWVRKKCSNPLFPVFNAALSGAVSMILNMPTFGAILATVALYTALVMWTPWEKLGKIKNYNYFISALITFAIVFPFWNKLLDICNPNNPCKQPLRTGTASVEVIVEADSHFAAFSGGVGYISLVKDQNAILTMTSFNCYGKRIGNNEAVFKSTAFNLDAMDNSIGKPIYCLFDAEYAQLSMPLCSNKVIGGSIVCIFNNAVHREIPILRQTVDENGIIIQNIGKYLKKEN